MCASSCQRPPKLPKSPRKAIEHLRASDPRMARAIDTVGRFALPEREATLYMACTSIIGQSISMKAAKAIVGRFAEKFGEGEALSARKLARADVETIRSVGLNRTKASAIRDMARLWEKRDWTHGTLRELPDAEIMRELTAIRGIGPWTVKMILIFGLRRPDVLPHEDLGVREGMRIIYGLAERPGKKQVEELAAAWAPWRTVGSVYSWQIILAENQQKLDDGSGWW